MRKSRGCCHASLDYVAVCRAGRCYAAGCAQYVPNVDRGSAKPGPLPNMPVPSYQAPAAAQAPPGPGTAIGRAVAGLRNCGYPWAEIGTRLNIARQAAQQRWGGSAAPSATDSRPVAVSARLALVPTKRIARASLDT
jgi:hypothetical protein